MAPRAAEQAQVCSRGSRQPRAAGPRGLSSEAAPWHLPEISKAVTSKRNNRIRKQSWQMKHRLRTAGSVVAAGHVGERLSFPGYQKDG